MPPKVGSSYVPPAGTTQGVVRARTQASEAIYDRRVRDHMDETLRRERARPGTVPREQVEAAREWYDARAAQSRSKDAVKMANLPRADHGPVGQTEESVLAEIADVAARIESIKGTLERVGEENADLQMKFAELSQQLRDPSRGRELQPKFQKLSAASSRVAQEEVEAKDALQLAKKRLGELDATLQSIRDARDAPRQRAEQAEKERVAVSKAFSASRRERAAVEGATPARVQAIRMDDDAGVPPDAEG
ncbi:MAG TPA: hypothetical protein VHA82_07595 [Ramlibacter sp.]|uniref:hypothetical protein n=1 Tax=Ramlibacter sp. TaxID=1917967 RepID=UPI002B8055A6|nr:hypothetical protein [Ramlibacter sp.]HVZ43659.1 hypothetical protein [Ramlibacter sp.]